MTITDYRAVGFSEDRVWPPGVDMCRLWSHHSRQIRDAGSRKELPRGVSLLCRVCSPLNSFLFHPRPEALLSKRLRADLRCEVWTVYGEDQLLGFRAQGAGFGVSRGVFRVLHVRTTVATWCTVLSSSGTTDLQEGLRARVVPEQSSRLVIVTLISFFFSFVQCFR